VPRSGRFWRRAVSWYRLFDHFRSKFIIFFNETFAHGAQEPHCQRCELSIAGTFRKIDGAHELHCQRCEFSVTDDSGKITPPNKFNKVD
jgi:hypothetical protein